MIYRVEFARHEGEAEYIVNEWADEETEGQAIAQVIAAMHDEDVDFPDVDWEDINWTNNSITDVTYAAMGAEGVLDRDLDRLNFWSGDSLYRIAKVTEDPDWKPPCPQCQGYDGPRLCRNHAAMEEVLPKLADAVKHHLNGCHRHELHIRSMIAHVEAILMEKERSV